MSDLTAKMIKDGNGDLVPQYYGADGQFHVLEGGDGSTGTTITNTSPIDVEVSNTSAIGVRASVTIDPDTFGAAPVVGQHTITSAASEVFADSSAKANRTRMEITNMGDIDIYVGPSGVTADNGLPIFPLETREFKFSSDTAVAIYAISPGKSVVCRVLEV